MNNKMLAQVEAKPMDSPFWKGLMRVKNDLVCQGFFKIGDGTTVKFQEDVQLGDNTLAQQYPALYNIVQQKNILVADVLNQTPLNIVFRRGLTGSKWNDWLHLCQKLMLVTLIQNKDSFHWRLTPTVSFTVKSIYLNLMNEHARYLRMYLWKLKIPLKIKNLYVVP